MQTKDSKRKSAIERRKKDIKAYEKTLINTKNEELQKSLQKSIDTARQDIANTEAKLSKAVVYE